MEPRVVIVDLRPILGTVDAINNELEKYEFQLPETLGMAVQYLDDDALAPEGMRALAESVQWYYWDDEDPDSAEINRLVEGALVVASYLHEVFQEARLYDASGTLGQLEFDHFRGPGGQDAIFVTGSEF